MFILNLFEIAPTCKKVTCNPTCNPIHALSSVMSKNTEIQFTAVSRQKSENRKLNFSKTNIYSLLIGMYYFSFSDINYIFI